MKIGVMGAWMLAAGFLATALWAQGDPAKGFDAATARRAAGTSVRIDLIGDSTQTDHAGYGLGFCANLTHSDVDCLNMAKKVARARRRFANRGCGSGVWRRSRITC